MANLSRACRNKCFAIRYVLHKLRYYEFRERVYFAERMRPTVRQVANFISEIRLTSKCGWRGCDGLTVKQFSLEMCTMFAEKILASIYLSGCLFEKTLLTFLSWIIFNFRRKSVFTVPVYIILINVAKTKPLDHIRLRGNCILDTIDIFPENSIAHKPHTFLFTHRLINPITCLAWLPNDGIKATLHPIMEITFVSSANTHMAGYKSAFNVFSVQCK